MNKNQVKNLVAISMVLFGAILFSAKAIFIKLAYRHPVDVISLLMLRMLFAFPVYLIIAYVSAKKKDKVKLSKKDWWLIIFSGITGYYLASLSNFYGLKYITASLERLILFVYPTLVVVFSSIVFRKRITRIQLIAIVLTYLGIAIAVMSDVNVQDQKNIWIGSAFIFGSAVIFAIYLVTCGTIIPKIGSIRFTAMAMSVSAFCVIAHYSVIHYEKILVQLDTEVYWLGAMIALFSTVFPSFLISEGIKRIGSSNTSIIASIGPVSTIVLAYLFLNESITFYQIIGTLIVIGGVLLISWKGVEKVQTKNVENKKGG
ncbi:DMT family transporter [Fulvivirgaceae bacterium BMA10]|uniref:DMT family transporter n=1 Tax=Splendidivirga corallicola TaxID=3051826 RepID=A0ABT8KIZ6_9BACT|nr:DMT family transporter [Fulvivirgaceae bacterium BMA10]